MATANVRAIFCAGGGHAHVEFRVNNVLQESFVMHASELSEVVTSADKIEWAKNFIRLHALGKTPAQVKTDLEQGTGFSATI